MITTLGKNHIKRYLSRDVATIGGAISCGIGTAAESADDTSMHFEIARVDVHLTAYDFVSDRLIFKASLPVGMAGSIHEVALWSLSSDATAGNYGSKALSLFEPAEGWAGTFGGGAFGGRYGTDSLALTAAANTTSTDTREQFVIDLSGYSSADTFKLAYETTTAFSSSVFVRFLNDTSNYYQFSHSPGGVPGYHIASWTKSSATVTGSPSWSNINAIVVGTTAAAGGVSTVYLDALRIEDVDPFNTEYVMVSRNVLTAPITKLASKTLDIEYSMVINI